MAKGEKVKIKPHIGRPRKFSVGSKLPRQIKKIKRTPTSRYRLRQAHPSKFTIYHEEPSKGFFSGRSLERHAYRTVIIVIISTVVTVLVSLIFLLDHPPERQVKDKIYELAATYYEDIFYLNLINSDSFDGNFDKSLSKYIDKGLYKVNLRQFILLEDVDEKTSNYLRKYCDEDSTYVRFFPEPPYFVDSYHTEVTYSCNF